MKGPFGPRIRPIRGRWGPLKALLRDYAWRLHANERGTFTPGILQSIPSVAFANPNGNVQGNLGDVVLCNTGYVWYCYSGGYASGTVAAKWVIIGITPPAPNASAMTVPASGTAFTNTAGYPIDVYWTGGTLTTPFVQVVRNAINTAILGLSQAGAAYLDAGDGIIFTYSTVPTVVIVPAAI